MLSYLRIRGLALLDDVTIELGPGLSVLTGETGAGKSIIVDALALLRGGRGRAELVRSGEESCIVDAQFDLDGALAARVRELLERHGTLPSPELATAASAPAAAPPPAPRSLVLQRAVARAGRGRVLIDAELSTQTLLAELGEQLVDVCSQHEHQSLTRPARQVELLDDFASTTALAERCAALHADYLEAKQQQQALLHPGEEPGSRAEYLRFQLDELLASAPAPGELAELRGRVARLRDARAWIEFASSAYEALYDGDEALCGRLASLLARLRDLERRAAVAAGEPAPAAAATPLAASLETALAACSDAAQQVARLGLESELEPSALEQAEERLHQLVALERKHGDLAAVPAMITNLEQQLAALEQREERLAAATALVTQRRLEGVAVAEELSQRRRSAAPALGAAITAELAGLHLGQARVEVSVTRLPDEELGPRGVDRIELLFSANPGEPLAPMSRVASGGELSRLLLALKTAGSSRPGRSRRATSGVATYVFDEVDAGVGGAVAIAIGQRLRAAAAGSQVLCITHLPQVAAFADAHFRVEKQVRAGRTTARVVRLDEAARVEELARMLGGAAVTESARAHARQLLAEARRSAGARRRRAVSRPRRPDTAERRRAEHAA